jgi:hypothetical protein
MWRQETADHHAFEIKLLDFRKAKRLHFASPRASGEQIRMPAAELARARPSEQERKETILDQPMHLIKQSGNFLDLVDHNGATLVRGNRSAKPFA